jgi:hypothetical protein
LDIVQLVLREEQENIEDNNENINPKKVDDDFAAFATAHSDNALESADRL